MIERKIKDLSKLIERDVTSDGLFAQGKNSVKGVYETGDCKTEIIFREDGEYAKIIGSLGISTWYKIPRVCLKKPVKAVLMDLDGTTVKSEAFWINMLELMSKEILNHPGFEFLPDDIPNLSGNSVAEHIDYCIKNYFPDMNLHYALRLYYRITYEELKKVELDESSFQNAFIPNEGLKDFLLELKSRGIKIALVTSGIYAKAYREIDAAFRLLGLGKPEDFYDAIITGGYPAEKGVVGTLGELPLKPHPWLYAEVCHTGLKIPYEQREHIVCIEDSGPGACAARLAGYNVFGLSDGNILDNGYDFFCNSICNKLEELIDLIF